MPESNRQIAKYQSYRHRCVQDLAWCVFSPALVADDQCHEVYQPDLLAADQEFLRQLDDDPQELIAWLAKGKSTRLGVVFERFWQYWWLNNGVGDEWKFNLQIHRDGRTLGELDALQWHPQSFALTHYELAVKFYLGIEKMVEQDQSSEELSWVGPNCTDRLDIKWPQMNHQQLTALTDDTRAPPLGWPYRRLITRSLTRGRLFRPLGQTSALAENSAINPNHETGQWLRLSDWELLNDSCWRLLERNEWLAPLYGTEHDELLTHAEAERRLLQHFDQYRQPVQIIKVSVASDHWIESERLFVVPSQWPPATAQKS